MLPEVGRTGKRKGFSNQDSYMPSTLLTFPATIQNTGMGKFEVYKNKSGEFRFRLKAGNGQTILASEGYTTKAARDNGIESVRNNATDENRYANGVSTSSQPYFNLTATNGQVIGKSEMYESESARDNGIQSVMKNAPEAKVVES